MEEEKYSKIKCRKMFLKWRVNYEDWKQYIKKTPDNRKIWF